MISSLWSMIVPHNNYSPWLCSFRVDLNKQTGFLRCNSVFMHEQGPFDDSDDFDAMKGCRVLFLFWFAFCFVFLVFYFVLLFFGFCFVFTDTSNIPLRLCEKHGSHTFRSHSPNWLLIRPALSTVLTICQQST